HVAGFTMSGSPTLRHDLRPNNPYTPLFRSTGSLSYADTNSLTVGSVTDTAMSTSVSTSGITSNGSDVKLATGGDLALESAVTLGARDLTRKTTGNESKTSAGAFTT